MLEGALEHEDSLGTGSTVGPGEVQKMTAGTGILHSELNPSPTQPLHFLQVWILPERKGLPPSYDQRTFSDADKRGRLKLIGSRDGRDGSIGFQQDVSIFASILGAGEIVRHRIARRPRGVGPGRPRVGRPSTEPVSTKATAPRSSMSGT